MVRARFFNVFSVQMVFEGITFLASEVLGSLPYDIGEFD